jgi:hypothetical protein
MRSSPPGEAARSPRRAVFSAALEQAEQLFSGAASADYVIKPILIFYGFNQACRAIPASSSTLDHRTFRPRSHGMDVVAQPADLAGVKLAPRPSPTATSMLATLQTMLGSPPWSEPVTLGQLWSANPDLAEVPLPNNPYPVALHVTISVGGMEPSDPLKVVLHQLPSRLLAGADESNVQQLLRTAYPDLANSVRAQPLDFLGTRMAIDLADDKVNLYRRLPWNWDQEGWILPSDISKVLAKIGMWRENEHWLIPKLGGNPAPPHILVLWWALLFALSMRARYEPERWTRDLNPDQSSSAVVLETLLDMSMGICPELIVETMPSV